MKRIVEAIRRELREAMLPMAFFLVVFHVVALVEAVILDAFHLTLTGAAMATVAALLAAKAILIADRLPFIDRFAQLPLVYGVLWRTAIYSAFVCALRIAEEIVPHWISSGSFRAAIDHAVARISWQQVVALQLWLVVAMLLYSSLSELDRHFGEGSLRRAFFGIGRDEDHG